jgi:hypothetical protein
VGASGRGGVEEEQVAEGEVAAWLASLLGGREEVDAGADAGGWGGGLFAAHFGGWLVVWCGWVVWVEVVDEAVLVCTRWFLVLRKFRVVDRIYKWDATRWYSSAGIYTGTGFKITCSSLFREHVLFSVSMTLRNV